MATTPILLKPSPEQQAIIDSCKTHNLILDSVAASGKTTTNMFIAKANPASRILLLTYNAKLKVETRDRAVSWGIKNMEVHSYHSFCVKYYCRTAYTDAGITKILKQSSGAGTGCKPLMPFKYDIIMIDEAQDMTPKYFGLICKIWRDNANPETKLIISGDVNQCIFRFNGADSRFISMADQVFGPFRPDRPWKTLRLATSFRCPIELTTFLNKCVLKSDRMIGVRSAGHKPRYIVCDSFGYTKTNRTLAEVQYYLSAGYTVNDIFIIAPSIKAGSGNSPVRRLANSLSAKGIPIFVPVSDEDKLDEDVCTGKLVFASFHQVKGLERPVVIVFNFDASYFKYYSRDADPKVCPNELYVALTRAKERISLFHQAGNEPLHFLDMNKKFVYYEASSIWTKDAPPPGPDKVQDLAVTMLVHHLQESVMDRAMEYLTITQTRKRGKQIKLKTKTKQSSSLVESVAELNGLVIPSIYELRTFGRMEMLDLIRDSPEFAKLNAESRVNLDSIPSLLEMANIWNSHKTGFIFKIKQITKYDWLGPAELDECLARLATLGLSSDPAEVQFEHRLFNQGSRELYGRRLIGYADYMDKSRLIEFKCVSELDPAHFIQLAVYMYLAKLENQRQLVRQYGAESLKYIKAGDKILFHPVPPTVIFGVTKPDTGTNTSSMDTLTGEVILVESGQIVVNELGAPDKVHDLRPENNSILVNLTWAHEKGLIKKYTYQLYNILTDELFSISADLGSLRQMVDYLIYQKYYGDKKKTDEQFIQEVGVLIREYLALTNSSSPP